MLSKKMMSIGLLSFAALGMSLPVLAAKCKECSDPSHREWVCTTETQSELYRWYIHSWALELGEWTSEDGLNGRTYMCASPSDGGKPTGFVLLDDFETEDWIIDACPKIKG